MESKPFLTSKAGRILWTALTLVRLVIRLPFLLAYFSLDHFRPHPRWTIRQCVAHEILRMWFQYVSAVELPFAQSLEPGAESERWAVIPAAEDRFYKSPLLDADIRPAPVGGTWYPRKYQSQSDRHEKVILHCHGGAFVLSDARDRNCALAAKITIQETSAMMFFVDYRLCSSPTGRFPAALQDAVTSYLYILGLGVPPSHVIISGDSAGGNLAVGLLRYIEENADLIPKPSAALLWSPWLDLTMSPEDVENHHNFKLDYLPPELLTWAVREYRSPQLSVSHPYISPSHHPFPTTTPIWISVGNLEIFRDQAVEFADDMQKIPGNHVEFCELSDVAHDTFMTAHLTGRADKAVEGAVDAAGFLRAIKSGVGST